jgi:hypothetical protein
MSSTRPTETLPIPQIIRPSKTIEFPEIPKELEAFRKLYFSAIPLEVQANVKQFNPNFKAIMQRYRGLGLVEVLMTNGEGKYFTVMLGGSNGWDRNDNYSRFQNLVPDVYDADVLLQRLSNNS